MPDFELAGVDFQKLKTDQGHPNCKTDELKPQIWNSESCHRKVSFIVILTEPMIL